MQTKIEKIHALSNWLMTSLKPHPKLEGTFSTTVNFSGYSSLFATIADLMKLCTVAMLTEEPHISYTVNAARIDMAGIMELALQLMPHNEAEFLDEIRNTLSESSEQTISLEYNYSSVRILESFPEK